MAISRRDFLRRTGGAGLSAAAVASGIKHFGMFNVLAQRNVDENAPTDYRALVCIFLSGGNDANNMLVPLDATGYSNYFNVRNASGLAIAQASLLPLNPNPPSIGTPFGLHPNLPDLQTLWSQGKLAIVSNAGPLVQPMTRAQYQNNSRPKPYQLFSHSDQVTQWQTSISNTRGQTGWGGRTADHTGKFNAGFNFPMITTLAGTNIYNTGMTTRPLSIAPAPTSLTQVLVLNGFGTSSEEVARRSSMDYLRTIDRGAALVAASSDVTQQAIDISQAFSTDPTLTTVFPNTTLGNQLKQVAKVMKLNQTSPQLGLNRQIFFCSLGGFDTHQTQTTSQGNLFTQLSQAMKAFYDATVELAIENRVTTFTLSDFGRTLQPSGSGATFVGSDHGWGNHQFVMGGAVRGSNFYGVAGSNGTVYPTLQLSGPDDTDSRGRWIPTASVEQYAATLASWYGVTEPDMPEVFPLIANFTPQVAPYLNFML